MKLAVIAAFRHEVGGFLRRGGFREAGRSDGLRFYRSESAPGVSAAVGGLGRDGARASALAAASRFGAEMLVSRRIRGGAPSPASAPAAR